MCNKRLCIYVYVCVADRTMCEIIRLCKLLYTPGYS